MSLNFIGKKSIVGLDLGHYAIRAAEIEPSGDGWQMTKFGVTPTPADAIKDGVVVDASAVGAAIRQLFRESHISGGEVSIAVGGGTIVVRNVRMPQMTEATLRKSIRFEAGRYVPTSVEDSFIEFEILGHADENQMDVLMVAAPKDIVSSRMAACEHAGLSVNAVDVEMFATFRSLVESDENPEWSEKTIALVDVGAAKTNMSVVRNGQFAMTRSIPQGGQVLTDALSQHFKLNAEEAEQGKSQLDLKDLLGDHGENPPLRVIQPHVDDLIREIRRSLNYYQSQLTEGEQSKNVDLVVITGGGSQLQGLEKYAEHKLKLPTISMGVFSNSRFSFSGANDFGEGKALSVVSGLAMRAHNSARAKAA